MNDETNFVIQWNDGHPVAQLFSRWSSSGTTVSRWNNFFSRWVKRLTKGDGHQSSGTTFFSMANPDPIPNPNQLFFTMVIQWNNFFSRSDGHPVERQSSSGTTFFQDGHPVEQFPKKNRLSSDWNSHPLEVTSF